MFRSATPTTVDNSKIDQVENKQPSGTLTTEHLQDHDNVLNSTSQDSRLVYVPTMPLHAAGHVPYAGVGHVSHTNIVTGGLLSYRAVAPAVPPSGILGYENTPGAVTTLSSVHSGPHVPNLIGYNAGGLMPPPAPINTMQIVMPQLPSVGGYITPLALPAYFNPAYLPTCNLVPQPVITGHTGQPQPVLSGHAGQPQSVITGHAGQPQPLLTGHAGQPPLVGHPLSLIPAQSLMPTAQTALLTAGQSSSIPVIATQLSETNKQSNEPSIDKLENSKVPVKAQNLEKVKNHTVATNEIEQNVVPNLVNENKSNNSIPISTIINATAGSHNETVLNIQSQLTGTCELINNSTHSTTADNAESLELPFSFGDDIPSISKLKSLKNNFSNSNNTIELPGTNKCNKIVPASVENNDSKSVQNEVLTSANTLLDVLPTMTESDAVCSKTNEVVVPESNSASGPKSWASLFKSNSNNTNESSRVVISTTEDNEEQQFLSKRINGVSASETCLGKMLSTLRLNHKPVPLIPRGLINRANWCYVNATLQALLACPPFYNLIRDIARLCDNSGISLLPITESLVEFVNEFTPMTLRTSDRRTSKHNADPYVGPTLEAASVFHMLNTSKYAAVFKQGRQEDAEEFLSCILNGLHDEMVASIQQFHKHKSHSGKDV